MEKNLKIIYVPTGSLHHVEYNPRIINEATKASVRTSIEMHGIQDPLIVNNAPERKGTIIGGNLRFEVMKDMGFKEVPVLVPGVTTVLGGPDLNSSPFVM